MTPPPAARQAWRAALLLAAEILAGERRKPRHQRGGWVLRRSRPLHPTEPHRDQALVDHNDANLGLGVVHQLLDHGQERIDQPPTAEPDKRGDAGVAAGDIGGDGLGSQPTSCAADQAQRVRSKASRISMISLADLANGPSGVSGFSAGTTSQPHRRAAALEPTPTQPPGDLAATHREFWCPSARTQLSTRWEFHVAAQKRQQEYGTSAARPTQGMGVSGIGLPLDNGPGSPLLTTGICASGDRTQLGRGEEMATQEQKIVQALGGGAGSTHLMCPHCGKRVDLTYRSSYELALDLAVREPPPDEEVRPGDRG